MRPSRLAVVFLTLSLCACGTGDRGPALFVEVIHGEPLTVDQLELSVELQGGPSFGPLLRPQVPAQPLASGQTVRLLLPESASTLPGLLRATGLSGGAAVASGEQTFTAPVMGDAEVQLILTARTAADPCAGVSCEQGQRCEQGTCVCDERSCSGGCCAGTVCKALAVGSCGPPGGACMACDLQRADRCGPDGCQCGSGAACSQGQRCEAGSCRCDAASCGGCCAANGSCLPGSTALACGKSGGACHVCKDDKVCSGGKCEG